jgi:uncharacterized membrane protein YphA (DoxX/SURF4 family)
MRAIFTSRTLMQRASFMSELSRSAVPEIGSRVFGAAAIGFGIIALIWRDFATVWHPVPATVPHRAALVYITAILLLAGGAGVQWRRTLRSGLLLLAILYLLAACLWLPRVIGYPELVGTWSGFAQQFCLTVAAMTVYAMASPLDVPWAQPLARVGRVLFGLCAIIFGVAHFLALPQTAELVPAWLPLGQRFWAIATGIVFVLAGISMLVGICAMIAAVVLAAMLASFGLLIWLPSVIRHPHEHIVWAGNAINLAVTAAAWMMAESLRRSSET